MNSVSASVESRSLAIGPAMEGGTPDVLIVGAGPGGLTLAYLLHRQGVSVRIIDKDAGPTNGTRAPVLWQRTQEILAAVGLRDALLESGHLMTEESLHLYDRASATLPLLDEGSPYERPLLVPQSVTEQTLSRCLAEAGLLVNYHTEAIAYTEAASGSQVRVRHADGREESLSANWVVAAEGAKSVIRSSIGLDFAGENYDGYRIHVADVTAEWTYATPVGQGYFFIRERAYMGGQRLPGEPNRFYFYILTVDEDPDKQGGDLDLMQIQQLVREISGDAGAILSTLHWGNTAHYRHGVADTFRRGRALLLGDTAHIVIPIYGQGMNYAIHDAWNLAWKLRYVLGGLAPESLLDTYTDERRGLALDLDERIDETFRLVTEPKPLQVPLLRAAVPLALSSETLRHGALRRFTQLDLSYAGLGLSRDKTAVGKLQAGDRVPALWTKRLPDCTSVNLLDLFDGSVWTLLLVHRAGADPDACQAAIASASALEKRYSGVLQTVRLQGGSHWPALTGVLTLMDAEERLARQQDLPPVSVLLVRPDGYIALLTRTVAEDLDRYLTRWLSRPIANAIPV